MKKEDIEMVEFKAIQLIRSITENKDLATKYQLFQIEGIIKLLKDL